MRKRNPKWAYKKGYKSYMDNVNKKHWLLVKNNYGYYVCVLYENPSTFDELQLQLSQNIYRIQNFWQTAWKLEITFPLL
jgi:hypothetical protein